LADKKQKISTKKEIGKKRKAFKFFVTSLVLTGLSIFGLCGATFLFVETVSIPLSVTFLGTGLLGLFTAISSGMKAFSNVATLNSSRKKSLKALELISNEKSNKTLAMSKQAKIKILKKYAKSNLKHCKVAGNSSTGKLHSISGMQNEKQTKAFNEIENLEILKQLTKSERQRKKFDKKISKKKKILYKQSIKTVPQRWTKSYDHFIDGISIYDRRTEIGCLNPNTSEKFKQISENISPSNQIGGSVIVSFGQNKKIQKTYARISDVSKLEEVKNLMLNDVLDSCKAKDSSTLFPFTIETYGINKKNAKTTKRSIEMIQSLDQLVEITEKEEEKNIRQLNK